MFVQSEKRLMLLSVLTLSTTLALGKPLVKKELSARNFDTIPSTENLVYYPCLGAEQLSCARLSVPLDYSNPAAGNASIALARLPANITSTADYKGVLLVNPGGPGGSGVEFLFGISSSAIIGELLSGYDIIGFDPRGVGFSLPQARCYDFYDQQVQNIQQDAFGSPGFSNASLYTTWAQFKASGLACEQAIGGEKGIGAHMSTAVVARDMISIADAHQALSEGECSEKALVNYWGFSYGSYIGQTFASLHPDRVGRFVIDGIVNATNYATSSQLLLVRDTDKVLLQFFSHCVQAGSKLCTFAGSAKTAADLETKYYNIVDKLQTAPAVVIQAHSSSITSKVTNSTIVITSDYLRRMTFSALYRGFQYYTSFSAALTYVEQSVSKSQHPIYLSLKDPANSFFYAQTIIEAQSTTGQNETVVQSIVKNDVYGSTAEQAIGCSDGEDLRGTTAVQYIPFFKEAIASSKLVGQYIASFRLACTNWLIRPTLHFAGPFVAAKTKTPILVVSNVYDPITPYVDGVQVHENYKDSGFLVINSTGHSSLNTGSICAFEAIATYLNEGILPPKGTVCESAVVPFGNSTSTLAKRIVVNGVLKERDYDMSEMSRVVRKSLPLLN